MPCCLWFSNGTRPWVSRVSDSYIVSRKWESCVKFTVHVTSCTSVSRCALTRADCTGRVPRPRVACVELAQTRRVQRGSESTHRVIKGEWLVGIEPSTLRDWFRGHSAGNTTYFLPFRTCCCRIWVKIQHFSILIEDPFVLFNNLNQKSEMEVKGIAMHLLSLDFTALLWTLLCTLTHGIKYTCWPFIALLHPAAERIFYIPELYCHLTFQFWSTMRRRHDLLSVILLWNLLNYERNSGKNSY